MMRIYASCITMGRVHHYVPQSVLYHNFIGRFLTVFIIRAPWSMHFKVSEI